MDQPKEPPSDNEMKRCSVCKLKRPLSDYDIPGERLAASSCKRCRQGDYDRPPPPLTKIEKHERVAELSARLKSAAAAAWSADAWRDYVPPQQPQLADDKPPPGPASTGRSS